MDEEDTLIVADWGNHRIMEWKRNATSGLVLAGGNGAGKRLNQLEYPMYVIVDKATDSLIICDWGNGRVTRWPRHSDKPSGETIMDKIACFGLAMDDEGSLYVTDYEQNEVRRYRKGETGGIVVAGGHEKGAGLHQLNTPARVCVDEDRTVYVADNWNHRVTKWVKDAQQGIAVAGGQGEGCDLAQLFDPRGVLIDAAGSVYVADMGNHRVMRWCRGATQGTIVVGGNGKGGGANQFSSPIDLSFDQQGNLYVSDLDNNRVQRFSIENT